MLPMRTPPQMLNPPNVKVVRGALAGLKKLGLFEMAEKITAMPDDAKALELLHEIDHLLWLKTTVWPNVDEWVEQVDRETGPGRWEPEDPAAARWCLLDRYRVIDMDDEIREWLEHGDDPRA